MCELILRDELVDAFRVVNLALVSGKGGLAHHKGYDPTPQMFEALVAFLCLLNDRYVLEISFLNFHSCTEPSLASKPEADTTVDLFIDNKSLPYIGYKSSTALHLLDPDVRLTPCKFSRYSELNTVKEDATVQGGAGYVTEQSPVQYGLRAFAVPSATNLKYDLACACLKNAACMKHNFI